MHSFMYKGLGYLGSMVVLNPVGLSLLLFDKLCIYCVVPLPLLPGSSCVPGFLS